MSIELDETTAIMTWPNGGYNESAEIAVTNEGIKIMDGYIILPWDWIDAARSKINETNTEPNRGYRGNHEPSRN